MSILSLFKQSQQPILFITTPTVKRHILKTIHEAGVFHPISFMHKEDLFNTIHYTYKPSAVFEAARFLQKKPAIAKAMMAFLHKVSVDETYTSERLKMLQGLKKHLEPYMVPSMFKDSKFSNQRIIVYGPIYDSVFNDLIESLAQTYDVEYYTPEYYANTHHTYSVFERVDEELSDLAIKIRKAHENGTSFKDIVVANVVSDYEVKLKNIFKDFSIPLTLNTPSPLSSYALTQTFYENLKNSEHTNFNLAVEESLSTLKPKITNQSSARIFQQLMRTLNPLIRFITDKRDALEYVWYVLETTSIKPLSYKDSVTIKPLDALHPAMDKHIYVVAMREGNAPRFKEEDEYLSAEEKTRINFPTATQENMLAKTMIDELFTYYEQLHFSFAKTSNTDSFLPSSHFQSHDDNYENLPAEDTLKQPYSKLSDLLQTKFERDRYDLYGETGKRLNAFHASFKGYYNTYSNTFGGLSKETVEKILQQKQSLSVTQIDDYYKNAFSFLLKHFLKLEPPSSPFHRDLGTFFHNVLENHLDKPQLSDELLIEELDAIIDSHRDEYTAKDLFFFKQSFEHLKAAHANILGQEKRTTYNISARETSLEKAYNISGTTLYFKGKIDKVLARGNNIILMDYKTGKATLDIRNAPHGLNAQLLYYVMLYKANNPTVNPVGFFEQTILPPTFNKHKNKTYETQVEEYFNWQGYITSDMEEIAKIDPEFSDVSMIKGLALKADGTFNARSKVIETPIINALLEMLEKHVKEALSNIVKGHFPINPKRINGKDVSTQYDKFKDISYQTPSDFVELQSYKKDTELFESLQGEED